MGTIGNRLSAFPATGRLTWILAAPTAVLGVAFVVYVLFTAKLAASPAMAPAVDEGDAMLVSRFDDSPQLGDIVVWENLTGPSSLTQFVHRVAGSPLRSSIASRMARQVSGIAGRS